MDFLLDALTEWLKKMLVDGIMGNLSGMFDQVNRQVADISVQVGQTPQGWNGSIFSMIQNLSNSIIVPIAGMILAMVMTIELIQMIADRNNLHDVDTWMIFKWIFKSAAAILIVTNTWNIVMGVFDMAQSVVARSAGIISSDASMLPFFMLAMYEKHGQPLEKIVGNIIKVAIIRPKQRPYQTNNFYVVLKRQEMLDKEVYDIVHGKQKQAKAGKRRAAGKAKG